MPILQQNFLIVHVLSVYIIFVQMCSLSLLNKPLCHIEEIFEKIQEKQEKTRLLKVKVQFICILFKFTPDKIIVYLFSIFRN